MGSGTSWVWVYTPTANLWYCLELRGNRAAIRGVSRNIFLAPSSLCMSGMWHRLKPVRDSLPMNHSEAFPEQTGGIEKMKKAWKYLENTENPTLTLHWDSLPNSQQVGFKGLPWWTLRVGSVLYLYLAAAETMNGIWSPFWENTHPFPQTGQSFGADHFRFVLSAEGERMQWGWNAGGLLSLLVNICLRAKWVTESWSLIS